MVLPGDGAVFDLPDGDDHLWTGTELSPALGTDEEVEEREEEEVMTFG